MIRFGKLAATFVASAFVLPSQIAGAAARPELIATVGPGDRLALATPNGRTIRTLQEGIYAIVVRDRTRNGNFHLIGPINATNKRTGLRFIGTVTWRLRLVPGSYTYRSDRNASATLGFRVR